MQNKKIYILHHIKAPDSQNTNLKKNYHEHLFPFQIIPFSSKWKMTNKNTWPYMDTLAHSTFYIRI